MLAFRYSSSPMSLMTMSLMTPPNLLSLSRLPLALLMAWCVVSSYWVPAVAILWISIFTDLTDGYLARRQGISTPIGGLLDHGSDAFFVTCTIAAWSTHGWAPLMLAVIIPLAFTQYMLDSKALKGRPLRASLLGRYNGIAYFVFAGFPVMQLTLGLTPIPFDWFYWIGWGLILTSIISMADRLFTLLRIR